MLLRARLSRQLSADYIVASIEDLDDAGVEATSYPGQSLGPFGPPVAVSVELGHDALDLDHAYANLANCRCGDAATRLCDCGTALCPSHDCTRECYQRARSIARQRERGVLPRSSQSLST